MKKLMMIVAMLMLVGCAAQQRKHEEQRSRNQEFRSQLIEAIESGSVVKCPNKPACDKAFSLAKIYVQENSEMRIQASDDTIITTYGSAKPGYISLQATKIPDAGGSSIIQLKAFCKDVDDSFETVCMRRETMIIQGFRPYVESRMQ